eukprot:TRINITY_DN1207_c0_g1_i1.p1 TRINITY_DN1207_c0_g1~~TRINITY_DN1207_c0_g1_i1.p1  ORF type:complete len:186 (+),score=34.98 TRINITY_DN1207_c0_g1_i1:238-795(+)
MSLLPLRFVLPALAAALQLVCLPPALGAGDVDPFVGYIPGAIAAVTAKYPDASHLALINGEYRPNIDNFHYRYDFVGTNASYKVVVNTFAGGTNFVVIAGPAAHKGLEQLTLPLDLGLHDAYVIATDSGLKPNLLNGVVFLQNRSGTEAAPAYWFLNDSSSTEWIQVDEPGPHHVHVTSQQPIQL